MILSIDVEDYFMVSAFSGVVKPEDWDRYESRVERNTHRILDLLDESAQAKSCVNASAKPTGNRHTLRLSPAPSQENGHMADRTESKSTFPPGGGIKGGVSGWEQSSNTPLAPLKGGIPAIESLNTSGAAACSSGATAWSDRASLLLANAGTESPNTFWAWAESDLPDVLTAISSNSEVDVMADAVHCRLASQNHAFSGTMPQRATFFCVSWVAQRFPGLIREIRSRGHEVASHGHSHRMITTMTPGEFRRDVRRSKQILEDITGDPILGYRAPSYSITRETQWALQILMEENFLYDASIAPVHHDLYGIPDAPTSPFLLSHGDILPPDSTHARNLGSRIPGKLGREGHAPQLLASNGHLVEFPMPTLRFLNTNLPFAGGGYFRILPYVLSRWGLKRHSRNGNGPGSFYIHPWELDPQQPRISGASAKSRFRHYLNLNRTETRFRKLLQDFDFIPFRSYLESLSINLASDLSAPIEMH